MKILIHTLDTNEHFKFFRKLIYSNFNKEHELVFLVQKEESKLENYSLKKSIKERFSIEARLIKVSRRNKEFMLYLFKRIQMIFYKKNKIEYDRKKWSTIKNYFRLKNKNIKISEELLKEIKIDNINNKSALIKKINPDLFIVVGAPFIKRKIIDILKDKIKINLHIGYLPYYRGILCPELAYLNNDFEKIGYTIHELSPVLDKGKVYFRESFNVEQNFVGMGDLYNRMYDASFNKILDFIEDDKKEMRFVDYSKGKLFNSYAFSPKNYKKLKK